MSYKVIARRYRPTTFIEVIGQAHITETIRKSIGRGEPAHAYLFSGPHGVGKTSLARIIAKALNCVNGPTAEPCGVCDSCVQINEGRSLDLIEIDGASNRGIDSIRGIIENVRMSPAAGKFKVYIIDEVHQITNEAFNALLKTLEEPPAHVVFILATTEVDRVLPTIRSRCQQYFFKRLGIEDIEQLLRKILDTEEIRYEEEGIFLIAKNARGSVRDSETLLEKMIAFVGEGNTITAKDVLSVIGSNNFTYVHDFFTAMIEGDKKRFFALIETMKDAGVEPKTFLVNLIEMLRVVLMMKAGVDDSKVLEITPSEQEDLTPFVRFINEDELEGVLEYVLDLDYKVRGAYNPALIFELRLMKLLDPSSLIRPVDVIRTLSSMPHAAAASAPDMGDDKSDAPSRGYTPPPTPQAPQPPAGGGAAKSGKDKKAEFYQKVLHTIQGISPSVFARLSLGHPVDKEGLTLVVALPENTFEAIEGEEKAKVQDVVKRAIAQHTKNPDVKIRFVSAAAQVSQASHAEKLSQLFNGKIVTPEQGGDGGEVPPAE